ncbi:hypothetical protein ACIPSK_10595 [Rhizobium sp. LARHSG275]|nr:hypothetical protein [Rhizobium laguerreae]
MPFIVAFACAQRIRGFAAHPLIASLSLGTSPRWGGGAVFLAHP